MRENFDRTWALKLQNSDSYRVCEEDKFLNLLKTNNEFYKRWGK